MSEGGEARRKIGWLCRHGFHRWGLVTSGVYACERDCGAMYDVWGGWRGPR